MQCLLISDIINLSSSHLTSLSQHIRKRLLQCREPRRALGRLDDHIHAHFARADHLDVDGWLRRAP